MEVDDAGGGAGGRRAGGGADQTSLNPPCLVGPLTLFLLVILACVDVWTPTSRVK